MEDNKELEKDNKLAEEQALLSEYKKLQANSVSKEDHEKVVKELQEKNALYLKAITEGAKNVEIDNKEKPLTDLISEVSEFKGTNLEYWKKMTKAIDRVVKETPSETISEIAGTEGLDEIIKVNMHMKKMVEDSNGDPDMFRNLFKDRVLDSAPRISAEINKAGSLANYLVEQSKKIK